MLRTLLRVYFWAICVLIITFKFLEIDDGIPMKLSDYIDWVFSIVSLSGVYAYCYSKPFLTEMFWKVYLRVLIVWDMFFVSNTFSDDPSIFSTEEGFVVLPIIIFLYIILLVPTYVALHLLPKEFERKESYVMKA